MLGARYFGRNFQKLNCLKQVTQNCTNIIIKFSEQCIKIFNKHILLNNCLFWFFKLHLADELIKDVSNYIHEQTNSGSKCIFIDLPTSFITFFVPSNFTSKIRKMRNKNVAMNVLELTTVLETCLTGSVKRRKNKSLFSSTLCIYTIFPIYLQVSQSENRAWCNEYKELRQMCTVFY